MVHHARKKVPALERGQAAGAGPDGGFRKSRIPAADRSYLSQIGRQNAKTWTSDCDL